MSRDAKTKQIVEKLALAFNQELLQMESYVTEQQLTTPIQNFLGINGNVVALFAFDPEERDALTMTLDPLQMAERDTDVFYLIRLRPGAVN